MKGVPLSQVYPSWALKARLINEDPNQFEVISQQGKNIGVLCKRCNVTITGTESSFEKHCKDMHKEKEKESPVLIRKRSFEHLEKFIEEQAKKRANEPSFYETIKDDPRTQDYVQKRAKQLAQTDEFLEKYEKEHPEVFREAIEKEAAKLVFDHMKKKI